jgi:transposase
VRKVYNMALAARTQAWMLRQERVSYNATSALLTAWKKTEDLAYLNEVSSVPLQQTSSKLCSACGAQAGKMPLTVRTWTCRCGTCHDRDVNAARNILAEGLSVIACGGGVRPQREPSRTGRSSVKQETQRATAGLPAR